MSNLNPQAQSLTPLTEASTNNSNWQLCADTQGKVWAVAINPGAKTSFFGDKRHLLNLMRQGHLNEQFIDAGIEFLSGLHNRLIGEPGSGKEWWLLSL